MKKVAERPLRLCFLVYLPLIQALDQVPRLNIHKLHLVGFVEHRVGNAFLHGNAGDGGDQVVEALDMLYIDRRVNVNAVIQKLCDILIPFQVAAAVRVGMRKLVNQNELRPARKRRVQVKLPEGNAAVSYLACRQKLQSV